MAKRKKYPKLPNGYGSIKYLGKGRRNPYAVHPPTTEFTLDGIPKTPKALCYVDDYMKGFAILTAYKAGTHVSGMEQDLADIDSSTGNLDSLAQTILADYGRIKHTELTEEKKLTFAEVYEQFMIINMSATKADSIQNHLEIPPGLHLKTVLLSTTRYLKTSGIETFRLL